MSLGIRSALKDFCVLPATVVNPAHTPPRDLAVDSRAFLTDRPIGALDLLVPSVVNAGPLVPGGHRTRIPHKSVVRIRYYSSPPRSVLAASASTHVSRSEIS